MRQPTWAALPVSGRWVVEWPGPAPADRPGGGPPNGGRPCEASPTTSSATSRSCRSATTCPTAGRARHRARPGARRRREPGRHRRSGRATSRRRLPHHFPIVPGWDVAGVVEAAGPAVVAFAPGDEVFGYVRRDDVQWGTTAEFVPAPQRCLAHKPESLSFAEAGRAPAGRADRLPGADRGARRRRGRPGAGAPGRPAASASSPSRSPSPSVRTSSARRARRTTASCATPAPPRCSTTRPARSAGSWPSRSTPCSTWSVATPSPTRRSRCATRPGSPRVVDPGVLRPRRPLRVRPARPPRPRGARPAWPTPASCGCRSRRRSRWSRSPTAQRLVAGGHVRGKVVVTVR